MRYFFSVLYFAFISVCASNAAAAEHYVGFGFGNAKTDIAQLESAATPRLFYGYAEGLRAFELEVSQADYSLAGQNTLSRVYRNIIVSYLHFYEINKSYRVYGKAGINFWNAENRDFGKTLDSDSGNSLALGLGVRAVVSDSLSVTLEYQRFSDVANAVITQMTVAGMYRFGH